MRKLGGELCAAYTLPADEVLNSASIELIQNSSKKRHDEAIIVAINPANQ
jgi:hypothetical protein